MSYSRDMRGFAAFLPLAGLIACSAFAQTPQFEVATIKAVGPLNPMDAVSGKLHLGVKIDAGRVDIGSLPFSELMRIAYEVKPFQISGPEWITTQRFDVVAKIPDGVPKEQVPAMLRSLLADRFKLTTHTEKKEHAVYALVVGKNGSKLKEATGEPELPPDVGSGAVKFAPSANGGTVTAPGLGTMNMRLNSDGNLHMEASRMSMPSFVEMLNRMLDRPVVDETALKGNYQVGFDLAPSDMMQMARSAGVAMPMGPGRGGRGGNSPADGASDPGSTIFQAVEAMGLKLEPRKELVDTVIVDHAEKTPTEN
jgi:uncharacterized protein (TIGR03435 family)